MNRTVGVLLLGALVFSVGTEMRAQISFERVPARSAPVPPPTRWLREDFVKALADFRAAIEGYREVLGQNEQLLEKKAKEIQKPIGDLMGYLKTNDVKARDFDEGEFADFSAKDLAWEALTTAERADNDLRLALRVMDRADRENVITIQALQFFGLILGDLQRLKWLTSKVADRPREEPTPRR